jgi:hypothetical protein
MINFVKNYYETLDIEHESLKFQIYILNETDASNTLKSISKQIILF